MIDARLDGTKELIVIEDGYRENREQARDAVTRFAREYSAKTRRPSRRWSRTPTYS
jgi:hypothetical protein